MFVALASVCQASLVQHDGGGQTLFVVLSGAISEGESVSTAASLSAEDLGTSVSSRQGGIRPYDSFNRSTSGSGG